MSKSTNKPANTKGNTLILGSSGNGKSAALTKHVMKAVNVARKKK